MAGTGYCPSPEETSHALNLFTQEVELVANGEQGAPFLFGPGTTDDLDMLTRELFEAHPITQLLFELSRRA